MFAAPRFIVVDDTLAHLKAILDTFQMLGSPCMGIHYDPATELERKHFRGVRGLFLDLHLIGGELGTDYRRQFAHVAYILENNIHSDGGPFVLVIWTQHPQLRQQLIDYLDDNLDVDKPHARPLAVLDLDKARFINLDSGVVTVDPALLRQAIDGAVTSNPQFAALINWETDVLAAAGATLSALLGLVTPAERVTSAFPAAINTVLSRLARASVGESNVAVDPRAAINKALSPILADRIVNQDISDETRVLWSQAVTRYADPALGNLSEEEAGQVNRMLHVAITSSETIQPTAWGAVVDFPQGWWIDAELRRLMGVTLDEFLRDEFKIAAADQQRCRPCLIRIGAACDHAQNRRGPLTYLFGLEIPKTAVRTAKPSASEWESPILVKNREVEPFKLHVNVRFGISLPADACGGWQVRYRLREQLLMHLISHASVHMARPGIVELRS